MKSILALLALAVFSVSAAAALPPGHPPAGSASKSMNSKEVQLALKGKVLNVINVEQYTYIEVAQEKGSQWLAGTTVAVKKGDTIRYDEGMVMTNFYSKTLKRTFPSIKFVGKVVVSNEKK